MSESWKFQEGHAHFVTFAVVGWIDVFTRADYAEFLLKSFAHCRDNKGLELHEFVIMPNHVHLIASSAKDGLGSILRDLKTYTSKELVRMIATNPKESRREWMLRMFREHGEANPQNTHHQFWQQENHPIVLDTPRKFAECTRYVRENPLRARLVTDEAAYRWGSANPNVWAELEE